VRLCVGLRIEHTIATGVLCPIQCDIGALQQSIDRLSWMPLRYPEARSQAGGRFIVDFKPHAADGLA